MADISTFFEEGIKSYLEQSFSKYLDNGDIIFEKNFDNNFLHPVFINDISLYKNLTQKNKLKNGIWGLILKLYDQKINQILIVYNERLKKKQKRALEYTQLIKNANDDVKKYEKRIEEVSAEIQSNNETLKEEKDETNNINNGEKEDLNDVKVENSISKINGKLIKDIAEYNKKISKREKKIPKFESKLRQKNLDVSVGKINILKLKILYISMIILINEIGNENMTNKNYNKEINYKLLSDYIYDFIDRCEKIKDQRYIEYNSYIKAYVIDLALIINCNGYKDINNSFLNHLLKSIKNVKETYSNSHIVGTIKNIEKLISSPDLFLCPNAFTILKNASFKKIKPRSRNNSFDKNDLTNNNTNIKNERNRKIDEFITVNKDEKSDSEDEDDDYQKKFSNLISFKNSSIQNNNSNTNIVQNNYNINLNFQSQSSLGLIETNKIRSYPNDSAISNNSLLYLENQNGNNILNSSKMSLDDSMSIQGMYRSGSCSELLGINSRLVSQLPSIRNTKQEKKSSILERFKKRLKMKKTNIKRKTSNEKLDKIFGKEIRKIVNNNFYSNENEYNKEKNTTATDTKKNMINEIKKEIKKTESNILVSKTPVKSGNDEIIEKELIKNNNNLKGTGIKKNLEYLFNQQTEQ